MAVKGNPERFFGLTDPCFQVCVDQFWEKLGALSEGGDAWQEILLQLFQVMQAYFQEWFWNTQ